jgi:hypothetical protein
LEDQLFAVKFTHWYLSSEREIEMTMSDISSIPNTFLVGTCEQFEIQTVCELQKKKKLG